MTLPLDITVSVTWEDDSNPDLSYLGSYTHKLQDGCVDRQMAGDQRYNECRYWMPSSNHYPHKPENWSHVRGKSRKAVIKKYGSIKNADAAYILADYRRYEDFNKCRWGMTICTVTARIGSLSADASLCGIESDSSESYKSEIVAGLTIEAVAGIKLKVMNRINVD